MSKKTNSILIALLILQIAIIGYVYRPGQNAAPPAVRLLESLQPENISSLTITDNGAKTLTLRKDSGWTVGPDKFPADNDKVASIIKKFSDLQSSRLVSRTQSSHNRLKVGDTDFNKKIELKGSDAGATVYLGTAPSSKSIHIRLAGDDRVFQVNDLAAWELQNDVESWWQSKYVNFNPDALTALTLENSHGRIALTRSDGENWQFEGPDGSVSPDQEKVNELVRAISNISIAEYMPPTFVSPGDAPLCTIAYSNKDVSATFTIWPKVGEEDDYIAKLSGNSFYAKIRGYILQDAINAQLSALIKQDEPAQLPQAGGETPEAEPTVLN